MTSISGASSSTSLAQQLLKRLDTDLSGGVSQSEFVNGRPSEVSESDATALFSKLNSSGTGELSATDLAKMAPPDNQLSGTQSSSLDPQMLLQLLEALQQAAGTSSSSTTAQSDPTSKLQELFSKLDANGDGSLTKDEFVAGRPDGVSETDAASLFDKIDTANAGTVTSDEFVTGMANAMPPRMAGGPPPPPPPDSDGDSGDTVSSTSSTSSTSTSSSTSSDALQQIIDKLIAGLDTDNDSTSTTNSTQSQLTASLVDFLKALQAYSQSYATSATAATSSATSSGISALA